MMFSIAEYPVSFEIGPLNPNIQRQRVYPGHHIAQRLVHSPVARDTRLTLECGGADADVEMALPAFLKACMAAMAFAVVDHL